MLIHRFVYVWIHKRVHIWNTNENIQIDIYICVCTLMHMLLFWCMEGRYAQLHSHTCRHTCIHTLLKVHRSNGYFHQEMDSVTQFQILDEAVCILNRVNSLGKGMNPPILPPAVGKIVGQTGLFGFSMVSRQGEGKLWIQTY